MGKEKKAKVPPPSEAEVEQMLKRMDEIRRKIEKKLEDAYEGKGLTYVEINKYMENSANFSEYEWEKLEKRRDEVREELLGKTRTVKKIIKKKSKLKRMRGARKNWLQMD